MNAYKKMYFLFIKNLKEKKHKRNLRTSCLCGPLNISVDWEKGCQYLIWQTPGSSQQKGCEQWTD